MRSRAGAAPALPGQQGLRGVQRCHRRRPTQLGAGLCCAGDADRARILGLGTAQHYGGGQAPVRLVAGRIAGLAHTGGGGPRLFAVRAASLRVPTAAVVLPTLRSRRCRPYWIRPAGWPIRRTGRWRGRGCWDGWVPRGQGVDAARGQAALDAALTAASEAQAYADAAVGAGAGRARGSHRFGRDPRGRRRCWPWNSSRCVPAPGGCASSLLSGRG